MEPIDRADARELVRIVAVVAQVVVPLRNTEEPVAAVAAAIAEHERRDARLVRGEREREQLVHCFDAHREVSPLCEHGLWHRRSLLRRALFTLDAALQFAHAFEVVRQLPAIAAAEFTRQRLRIGEHGIEHTATRRLRSGNGLLVERCVGVAEQAREHCAWLGLFRDRRLLAAPTDVVGVGTGVAGVTNAGHDPAFHAHFQRSEPRCAADLAREHLVNGNAHFDVRPTGLARMRTRKERSRGASMVANPVPVRATTVDREPAHHRDVFVNRTQRLQQERKHAELALCCWSPLVHLHAVRREHEQRAARLDDVARRQRALHRIEEGQRNHGEGAAQHGSA